MRWHWPCAPRALRSGSSISRPRWCCAAPPRRPRAREPAPPDHGAAGDRLTQFGYWVFGGDVEPSQRPSWNYRKEDGGGIVLDMYCHWRNVLDNLVGPVRSVLCRAATHIPERVDEAGNRYACTADRRLSSMLACRWRRQRRTSLHDRCPIEVEIFNPTLWAMRPDEALALITARYPQHVAEINGRSEGVPA